MNRLKSKLNLMMLYSFLLGMKLEHFQLTGVGVKCRLLSTRHNLAAIEKIIPDIIYTI
jgi:hypothetical protein